MRVLSLLCPLRTWQPPICSACNTSLSENYPPSPPQRKKNKTKNKTKKQWRWALSKMVRTPSGSYSSSPNPRSQLVSSSYISAPSQVINDQPPKTKLIVDITFYYCCTVWSNTSEHNLNRIHAVENVSARIVSNTRKYDHISPILKICSGYQ